MPVGILPVGTVLVGTVPVGTVTCTLKKEHEKLFILSDSKSAINCIRQRSAMRHFHSILSRIRSAVHILQGLGVKAVISWILSHSGIYWNEQVDEMAKAALQQIPDVGNNVITFAACKYIISKQITCTWQRRWDRSPTARTTYEYVPSVGKRTMFHARRCTALSYSRLLLNDSSLRIHQHHAGLVDTKKCECGQGVDDAFHYFFQCARFSHIHESLMQVVDKTWSEANCQVSPRRSVVLLLAPAYL